MPSEPLGITPKPRSPGDSQLTQTRSGEGGPGRKPRTRRSMEGPLTQQAAAARWGGEGWRGRVPGGSCQIWKKETGSHPSEQRPAPHSPTPPHTGIGPRVGAQPGGRAKGNTQRGAPYPAAATETATQDEGCCALRAPFLGDEESAGRLPSPLSGTAGPPCVSGERSGPPPVREPASAGCRGSRRGRLSGARRRQASPLSFCWILCLPGGVSMAERKFSGRKAASLPRAQSPTLADAQPWGSS